MFIARVSATAGVSSHFLMFSLFLLFIFFASLLIGRKPEVKIIIGVLSARKVFIVSNDSSTLVPKRGV